jgi:hypothetical protein
LRTRPEKSSRLGVPTFSLGLGQQRPRAALHIVALLSIKRLAVPLVRIGSTRY